MFSTSAANILKLKLGEELSQINELLNHLPTHFQ